MQVQQANYFKSLSQKTTPNSLQICSDRVQKRLRQITSQVGIFPHPLSIPKNHSIQNNPFPNHALNRNERKIRTQSQRIHKTEHIEKLNKNGAKQQLILELNSVRKAKIAYALKLKNTTNTLQKLKLQKEVVYTTRREQQLLKLINQEQIKIKNQEQSQQQRQRSIQRKRLMIKQKLKKIQREKQRREEILSAKSVPMIPRYKLMQKQFMMEQIRKEIYKNMQAKQSKQLKLLKYSESIDKGLKRHKNISSDIDSSKVKTQSNQKLPTLKKRKEMIEHLQQNRKKIKININQQARNKLQIQKDKLLNPYKYNYLKLKQLSDEQIYRQFKDFELQIDRNALGKQYFEQSKQKMNKLNSKHNVSIASSQENKINTGRSQPQSNQQRKKRVKTLPNSYQQPVETDKISSILRENQSKSKIIELLNTQMQKTKKNMDTKVHQLTKSKPYEDFLKLQTNIDKDYLSFLKAKIVSLQIHLDK